MSFQDELRNNYMPIAKKTNESVVTEILQIVKEQMLSNVKSGKVIERKIGFWGNRTEKIVRVKIEVERVGEIEKRAKSTPFIRFSTLVVCSKKEFKTMYQLLSERCTNDDIEVEVIYWSFPSKMFFTSKL